MTEAPIPSHNSPGPGAHTQTNQTQTTTENWLVLSENNKASEWQLVAHNQDFQTSYY